MEGKLNIYNAMRKVPEEALREIKGGKLKGKATSTQCGGSKP